MAALKIYHLGEFDWIVWTVYVVRQVGQESMFVMQIRDSSTGGLIKVQHNANGSQLIYLFVGNNQAKEENSFFSM